MSLTVGLRWSPFDNRPHENRGWAPSSWTVSFIWQPVLPPQFCKHLHLMHFSCTKCK